MITPHTIRQQQTGRFLLLMGFESFLFQPARLTLTRLKMFGTFSSKDLRKRFSKNVNERPHSEDELWAVMEKEWEAMDQAVIDRLIDSMPLRLQAIVKVGGSHIKW